MKKLLSIVVLVSFSLAVCAQREDEKKSERGQFKKENIFIGGTLGLGSGSGTFGVGANPEIGYSVTEWLDAGIVFNINYSSINPDYNNGVRVHQFNYGAGPFVRLYPVSFLFLHAGLEQNWVKYSDTYVTSGYSESFSSTASSFIAGVGYSQRAIGESSYFFMVGIDLLHDIYSPYRDSYGGAIPIVRAGFDFYLRPSRKRQR
jgi:hypothetical protein